MLKLNKTWKKENWKAIFFIRISDICGIVFLRRLHTQDVVGEGMCYWICLRQLMVAIVIFVCLSHYTVETEAIKISIVA